MNAYISASIIKCYRKTIQFSKSKCHVYTFKIRNFYRVTIEPSASLHRHGTHHAESLFMRTSELPIRVQIHIDCREGVGNRWKGYWVLGVGRATACWAKSSKVSIHPLPLGFGGCLWHLTLLRTLWPRRRRWRADGARRVVEPVSSESRWKNRVERQAALST